MVNYMINLFLRNYDNSRLFSLLIVYLINQITDLLVDGSVSYFTVEQITMYLPDHTVTPFVVLLADLLVT
jgi:hypothetical protein